MVRFIKVVILLSVVTIFFMAVGLGFLFILSGGDIVDYVQTTLIRLSLNARQDDLTRPLGTDETPIRFTVNPGDSPVTIARNLTNVSLILDAELFVDYVRLEKLDIALEAGVYFPNQTMTIPDIALMLTDSSKSFIPFRILEGSRIEEIADLIDQNHLFGFTGAQFLATVQTGAAIDPGFAQTVGLPSGASLEGFLFPDTYQLPPDITPEGLRDTLTQAFLDKTGEQLRLDTAAQGMTLYQIVIFASIVERESVWADENPLVASVYRNRFDIGMRLEADPTVQYGINGARGRWWPNITQADYRNVVSPYNTYINDGLPPGPIANPSLSAIRAAVYPAESDYYFFRARCDRSNYHNFATTYEEHVANGC